MDSKTVAAVLLAGASVLAMPIAALAQTSTTTTTRAESADQGIDDIVVTARRIEERLQDVPVAVTALTPEALRQQNVNNLSDLRFVAPSLQISPSLTGGGSVPGFTIRGQRQSRVLFSQDPSIAVYFAEVPQTRPAGIDTTAYDLAGVQVLKGPQGTLFGRNTTGGAIVITPQRPTDEFEGSIDLLAGNYRWFQGTAVLNIPISDAVQFRVAGNATRRDGYVTNPITGQEVLDKDSRSFRASLLLSPSSGFENLTVVDGYYSDNNGFITHCLAIPAGALVFNYTGGKAAESCARVQARKSIYAVEAGIRTSSKTHNFGISNITNVVLNDNLSFKNIAGYRNVRDDTVADFDATSEQAVEGLNYTFAESFSNEAQIIGKFSTFDFIVGAFYFRETGGDNSDTLSFQARGTDSVLHPGGTGKNVSTSIFGQTTIRLDSLTSGLSLTVGGRYTWDKREVTSTAQTEQTIPVPLRSCLIRNEANQVLPIDQCSKHLMQKTSDPSYNVSLNWKFNDDNLIYVAHRRGYRAGGFQVRATTIADFRGFQPETVKDVELGFKSDFRLGEVPVRLNIAAYKQWYSGIQRTLNVLINGLTFGTIVNAGRATVTGGEVELTIKPVENLTITANGALTKPKYKVFVDPVTGADLSANKFTDVPKYQGSATISYLVPLGDDGDITVSGTVYAQSNFQLSEFNTPLAVAPSYALVNGRIDWAGVMGTNLDLSLFVRNLLDKEYVTAGSAQVAAGYYYAFPGEPRMYGLQARYKF